MTKVAQKKKKNEAFDVAYKKISLIRQALVVQTLDSAIHRIKHYPAGPGCSNVG